MTGMPSRSSSAVRTLNRDQSGCPKLVAPPVASTPSALAGPGVSSPTYAGGFLIRHGLLGFSVLGAVFLTVTGAEALYADMGHFQRWPIQAAWLYFALPSLALNYLGQAAFALQQLHPRFQ